MSEKEEAINHVVNSTKYWLNSDPSLYEHYEDIVVSFENAVSHVKMFHYPLTEQDIECAKRKLIEKGYKFD